MGKRLTKPENPTWLRRNEQRICRLCGAEFTASWVNATNCSECKEEPFYSKWKTYRVSPHEQKTVLKKQSGRCAICLITLQRNGHGLNLDHDHKTGRFRGFLCRLCNVWLAALDDEEWNASARLYLGLDVSMIEEHW